MVHLQKFHEKYAKEGLQVFVISMHPERETAVGLAKKMNVTYPLFNGYKSDLGKLYAYG